jgi:adenosylcobyric acid synthase
MNPILIKPCSETGAQVVLLGRVWGQVTASDYHQRRVEELFPAALESFRRLAAQHDLIILEGAGSPAEINLRKHDIVNMRMAHAADAQCLLVGDIDRGGVFASLLGTIELLEPEDRARIRGFIVNKFRGDLELLRPGIEAMEQRLGIPCAGVLPYLRDVRLEEEDSVAMERRGAWPDRATSAERTLRIAVIALPHIANFTDFDALSAEPSVSLAFFDDPAQAAFADVLIIPGSKQTLDDLQWLHDKGFAELLTGWPGILIGVCGGFQMLGLSIDDPAGVESHGVPRAMPGLGRLPNRTLMQAEKTVRRIEGETHLWGGCRFNGYEIHMGETDQSEVIVAEGLVYGTYIHGLFDNDCLRRKFIDFARTAANLTPSQSYVPVTAQREARIDRWADHLRRSLDMKLIGQLAGIA